MKHHYKYIFLFVIVGTGLFMSGIAVAYVIYLNHFDIKEETNLPFEVEANKTNLPIIIINSNGNLKSMSRQKSISIKIQVIDNGAGSMNYFDTGVHNAQNLTFDGWAQLRLRGNTTFYVDKPSFSLKLTDGPNGNKEKSSLIGMSKADDWCLLAEYRDGSLMRNALTYELARNYFDYVPEVRFCEVVIDGKYMGIYLLSEKITKGKLGLKKSDKHDNTLSGGFFLEIDHEDEITFRSDYPTYERDSAVGTKGMPVEVKFPKQAALSSSQLEYIKKDLKHFEDAVYSGSYERFSSLIDIESFVSYQLVQEFSNNIDGFTYSHKFYKEPGENGLYKMTIWDFDIAYGSSAAEMGVYVDVWMSESRPCVFWWYKMAQNMTYRTKLYERWSEMRANDYDKQNIYNKIDSIYTLLSRYGAIERNETAWQLWRGNRFIPGNRTGNSYKSQVEYLKNWIALRLDFMDRELLGLAADTSQRDSACMNIGAIILYKNNTNIIQK